MVRTRKRNRKKDAPRIPVPAPFAAIVGLVATTAFAYLWFCDRCEGMGRQIQALETRKAEIHKRVVNEEYKWSHMKSPGNIENLLKQFNLEMNWPDEGRVVRVRRPEPPAETPPAEHLQLADGRPAGGRAGTLMHD